MRLKCALATAKLPQIRFCLGFCQGLTKKSGGDEEDLLDHFERGNGQDEVGEQLSRGFERSGSLGDLLILRNPSARNSSIRTQEPDR